MQWYPLDLRMLQWLLRYPFRNCQWCMISFLTGEDVLDCQPEESVPHRDV